MDSFARLLIHWYQHSHRDLPWRHTRHPYQILVSEVMLQQTRAATVIPYYERFLARFPTAADLAAAPESELLTLWAGLGYYSRARNLQKAALRITELGRFPDSFEEIRQLPGVGDYTAAAIASFAFSLPHAVLDGNVVRVMARVTAEPGHTNSKKIRERLQCAADAHLCRADPATFNQALMELGATLCTPRKPQCLLCPVQPHCQAFRSGKTNDFPVKSARPAAIDEERVLLFIQRGDAVLAWLRPKTEARLAGFYDLPTPEQLPNARQEGEMASFRHSIVNTRYRVTVVAARTAPTPQGFEWLPQSELADRPLTTVFRKALRCIKKFTGSPSSCG